MDPPAAEDAGDSDIAIQLRRLLVTGDSSLQVDSSKDSRSAGNNKNANSNDDQLEQLAPLIKLALTTQKADVLTAQIHDIIQSKDQEIEANCAGDVNEYVMCTDQLGQVTSESRSLKTRVLDLSERLQQTGSELVTKQSRVARFKNINTNVSTAIQAVQSCLQVLDLTNTVHELLRVQKTYAAIRNLDELKNIYVKEVADIEVVRLINGSLPALRKKIRSDAVARFTACYHSLQEQYVDIGRFAFERISHARDLWTQKSSSDKSLSKFAFNSPIERSCRDEDIGLWAPIADELKPIYEGVLVLSSMGIVDELRRLVENDFKTQRETFASQREVFLKSQSASSKELFVAEFERQVALFAGFCNVTRMLSRSLPEVFAPSATAEVWNHVVEAGLTALWSHFGRYCDPESTAKAKVGLGLLLDVATVLEYDTPLIDTFMVDLFDKFSASVATEFRKIATETMQTDEYMPMVVQSESLFNQIVSLSWYTPTESESKKAFPVVLPFSRVYPLCCSELRSLIDKHTNFLSGHSLDFSYIEDTLRKTVDDLLINTIQAFFEERLQSTTREQIVQILINLEYFVIAAENLGPYIASSRPPDMLRDTIRLQAVDQFQILRKKAETRIFEILNSAIDNFLDLADYNWHALELNNEPSLYLTDLVSFLKTTVNSTLLNLPHSVKSFLYLDAFDHLASSLLRFLLEPGNMTPTAVANFDLDVQYLEDFVNQLARDSNDPSLATTTTELRQSVDLLRSDNISEYKNTLVRMKKYDRVKPENARALFSKISMAATQQQESPQSGGQSSVSETLSRYYRTGVDKLS